MAAEQEHLFLKLGDIKGKATTSGFKDQIVLQNLSYGISQGGSWEEGTQLSGRITTFSDVSCVKFMDVASPSLATACAAKQQVLVTSVSTAISAGEGHPSESFTLSFRKGTWEYGTARGGYDLETNQKV
jgi:type VI secretion system secreted protein Hcp